MSPGRIFERLSPYGRVLTAIAPIVGAIVLRLVLGRNKLTRVLLTVGTMWFAASVWLAPNADAIRREIRRLGYVVFR